MSFSQECKSLDIQFHLLRGEPELTLPGFVKSWNVGAVVTDFNPLRLPLQWTEKVKKELPDDIPFMQVCPSVSLSLSLSLSLTEQPAENSTVYSKVITVLLLAQM